MAGRNKLDPEPNEIAEQCEAIRAGWSEHETERRSAWSVEQEHVEPPIFRTTADRMLRDQSEIDE